MPRGKTLEISHFGMGDGFQVPGFRRRLGNIQQANPAREDQSGRRICFAVRGSQFAVSGEEKRGLVQSAGERPRSSTSAGTSPVSYGSDFSIQEPPHPSLTHT